MSSAPPSDLDYIDGDIVLVGNGHVDVDLSMVIDRSPTVVRFNNCDNYGNRTGRKIDWLAINNVAQPAMDMLVSGLPACGRNCGVIFTRSVEAHYRYYDACRLHESPKALVDVGRSLKFHLGLRSVIEVGKSDAEAAFESLVCLDGQGDFVMPSAGFSLLHALVHRKRHGDIFLAGFSFEGWGGHPWRKEKQLAERYAEQGLLQFLR